MPTAAPTRKDRLVIEVAADGMTASVRMQDAKRIKPPSEADILVAIEEAEVALDDDVRHRVAEYVRLDPLPDVFVVAEGEPVRHAEDERFVWAEEYEQKCAAWQDDAPVNYYSLNSILTVEKGAVIGRIEPPLPGKDGLTVRGETVIAEGTPVRLTLDETVSRAPDDPPVVIANTSGKLDDDDHRLRIQEVLIVSGDVSFETGNIDSNVAVHITGRIPDRFEVRSDKSITVEKAIEAATVTAGGDITVRRGIIGHRVGVVEADGEIVSKFATDANLVSGGDLKICRQFMNSIAFVGGRLIAEGASVIGGTVLAKDGIIVGNIGSDANVVTQVVAGVHPGTIREIMTLTRPVERAESLMTRIRNTVESIRGGAGAASEDQRRHIASLEHLIEEASHRATDDQERKEKLLTKIYAAVTPSIRVSGVIYAGVTIRLADREAVFHKDLKGPVSIERRKIKNVTEIVAVNTLSGSQRIINSERRSPQQLLEVLEMEEVGDHAPSRSGHS